MCYHFRALNNLFLFPNSGRNNLSGKLQVLLTSLLHLPLFKLQDYKCFIKFSPPVSDSNLSSAFKKLNKGLIIIIWQNANVFFPKKITFIWIFKVTLYHSLYFYCIKPLLSVVAIFQKGKPTSS